MSSSGDFFSMFSNWLVYCKTRLALLVRLKNTTAVLYVSFTAVPMLRLFKPFTVACFLLKPRPGTDCALTRVVNVETILMIVLMKLSAETSTYTRENENFLSCGGMVKTVDVYVHRYQSQLSLTLIGQ